MIGTGLSGTPAQNVVTFRVGGTAVTVTATSSTVLDAAKGTRRITVVVPDGTPVGAAGVEVRNVDTGEISGGVTLDIVDLELPETRSAAPGTTATVVINGIGNTKFDARTRGSFGTGVTLTGVSAQSPTRLTATISVAANAALGPRTISLQTTAQSFLLADAFVVGTPPPPNQAPVVSAGTTTPEVTLPALASLTGSVADDGLPSGGSLLIAWSRVSGPGVVTFTNANSPNTTATFSEPGTYALRLTGNDGEKLATADVTIAVHPAPPANQAPNVTAGANQTITLPSAAVLAGSVSDDGLPQGAPVTTLWTQQSGPGTATFADANVAATTATFSEPGTYVLRLTASDTDKIAFADVTITVNPAVPVNQVPNVTAGANQTITLPAAATLAGVVADDGLPVGATVTTLWSLESGPGTATFADPADPATTVTFSTAGEYVLKLTASDGETSASATVTVTANAPAITNRAPSVDAGPDLRITLAASATLEASAADDGIPAPLSYAWQKISGPGTVSFSAANTLQPTATFSDPGIYVLQLTVSDSELAATDDVVVTVDPESTGTDRSPPLVTLALPKSALPGAEVTVRVLASDDSGVADVLIEIDEQDPLTLTSAPFTRTFTLPQVVAPGSQVHVRARARDAAQNVGTAEAILLVDIVPDTENPTVQLKGPAASAAGHSVRVVADAHDNVGVKSVVFSVGGVEVSTDSDEPYEATFTVAADAQPGSSITAAARAIDFAGNAAESTLSIEVRAEADVTPPVITLTVPDSAAPGEVITIAADASDAGGIASVTLKQGAATIASLSRSPYTATFTVPLLAAPDSEIELSAEAVDFAALTAAATKSVRVRAAPRLTEGILTGEVYDDTRSVPLEGATVSITGADANGVLYADSTTTDARGRYLLRANAGNAIVRISMDGWTGVDRPIPVAEGQAIELLDARLTPLAPGQALAASAATLTAARGSLQVSAGAIPGGTTLRFTPLSQQGLQGRLPYGWTPVGAADIAPHGVALAAPARVTVRSLAPSTPVGPLAVVMWDEQAAAWRVVGTNGQRGADPATVEATIGTTGQFALVVADAAPLAPAPAVQGAELQGVGGAALALDRTTTMTPQPAVLFYQPGVRSDVHHSVTTGSATTSGTLLTARVTEAYTFTAGGEAHPEPFVEDLLFFQDPSAPTSLSADVSVSPSLSFDAVSLSRGTITVELFDGASTTTSPLVGVAGGQAAGPSGEMLILPAGAVDASVPVSVRALPLSQLGVALPSGIELAAGVGVDVPVPLARGGVLSVAKPANLPADAALVVVRLVQIKGQTRMLLVAAGRIDGERIVSDTTIAGQQTALEGVRGNGRYAFLVVDSPIGFAGGIVSGIGGAPFAGALVTAGTLPIVSLSNGTGAYVAVARAGAATLTATDLEKSDSGSASAYLASGALTPLALTLVAQPPRITSIAPADGAINVALGGAVTVTFSEPIDPATVSEMTFAVTGPSGAVSGIRALSQGNSVLTFRAADAFEPNARYTVALTSGITDVSGYALATPQSIAFDSLDTRPPPPPPAGAITASIPNSQGLTTVSATQGTAGPRDRVFVDNLTTGAVAVALVEGNGSFSTAIAAKAGNTLRVRIVDEAGNETTVDLDSFRQTNPDGSVSQFVSAAGGVVEGPEGIQAEVPAGAFDAGAVVTIKPVPLASFPVTMTPEEAANFPLVQAVSLDFGGAEPKAPLRLSVEAKPGDTAEGQWLVLQVVDLDGRKYLNVADTAHYENGRIVDPPTYCPGVLAAAVYGIVKSAQTYGLNFAQMYADGRYKLQAQTNLLQAGLPFAIPYTTFNTILPTPVCFPVLSGRVTVSPNVTEFSIPSDELYLADKQIVIRNLTRGTEKVAERTLDYERYSFAMTGSQYDSYRVEVTVEGREVSAPFDLRTGPNTQSVVVVPRLDRIAASDDTFTVINLTRNIRKVFTVPLYYFETSVTGSIRDTWELLSVPTAVSNAERRLLRRYTVRATEVDGELPGEGNMVVRARPGTIDPTRAEADAAGQSSGAARTVCPAGQTTPIGDPCGVVLTSASGRVRMIIPNDRIHDGGFAVAFDGDPSDSYSLTINYDIRPPFSYEIPRFSIDIISTVTKQILRTITGQAPPRDEPLDLSELIGRITNDFVAPFLLNGPSVVTDLGSGAFLSFTFSKPMDAESLKANVVVTDADGNPVAGEIRVSDGNRTVTFVPSAGATGESSGAGLQLGQTYFLTLKGIVEGEATAQAAGGCQAICDAAGNLLRGIISLPVTTFGPKVLQHYSSPEPLKDVAIVKRTETDPETDEEVQKTYLLVPGGSIHLHSFDVTDVSKPPELLQTINAGATGVQRITVIPNANILTASFAGSVQDAAVVSAFNASTYGATGSWLNFFDVSDVKSMVSLGREMLATDSTELSRLVEGGFAATGNGYAKGITGFLNGSESGAPLAFTAVERVGLFGFDVKKQYQVLTGIGNGRFHNYKADVGGDFTDVASYGCSTETHSICSKIVAIKRTRDSQDLVVAGSDLSITGAVALPFNVRRLRVAQGMRYDLDRDGRITLDETLDLAFVGGDRGIIIVLLGRATTQTTETLPRVFGSIPMSGNVLDLEIDADNQQVVTIFNSTYTGTSGPFLAAVDVSQPNRNQLIDNNNDGVDDRIVFRTPYPSGVNGMRLDADRQLLYVATPGGLDIVKVGNLCCDLKVDMEAPRTTSVGASGSTAELLAGEKKALKTGIVKGLARAMEKCDAFDPTLMRIWESGSSACLWTDNPVQACGRNYQPGISDHDLSTFMPDEWYRRMVANPDKTDDPKDKRPAQVPLASCVVQALTYPFANPNISDPEMAPREPEDPEGVGFRFADISFLPNYTVDLESMRYRLARTMPGIPGDSDNTLGLGMQGLILKHLTEAYGVNLQGVQDPALGYRPEFDRVGVSEEQIQQYLLKYRTDPTVKIPTVEGYEWANLMEYQLRKAYTAVRIRGADDANSQFHDLFISQLHLAGKAGIRAALGRLSAVEATRDLILNFRRDSSDVNRGPIVGRSPLTLRGPGANACRQYDPDQPDPRRWNLTECSGMEHYVASVAVNALDLQDSLPPSERMFTLAEVRQVFDFYLVKADQKPIDTDQKADDFIGGTFQFVLRTKELTEPEYRRWINASTQTSTHPIDATPDPDQLNGGAQDPEGTTTTRGQRRVNNLARKDVRMVAKAKTHLHVIPHVRNRGTRTVRDIKLGMYYKLPGGSQQQYAWTQVDTGTTLSYETLQRIDGGQHLYPAWQTDGDGALSREPNPDDEEVGKTIDLFELEVDQADANRGQPGYVVFTVDLPDRTAREANRQNNYDGFYFFVLDPAACTANSGADAYGVTCAPPPGVTGKVPFPLSGLTLLAPDSECDLFPELTITQSVTVGTQTQLAGPVTLAPGQQAQLTITVTNDSDVAAKNVVVRTPLGGYQSMAVTVGAHESVTFTPRPVSWNEATVALSLPSLTAPDVGFQIGPSQVFLVNACTTGPAIVGLDPNPNPSGTFSRVMRNGKAVRYFRALDPLTGLPLANVELVVRVQGMPGETFTFTSDADGVFGYQATRVGANGQTVTERQPGVAIPFESWLGSDGGEARVLIEKINGDVPKCGDLLFSVYVDPFKFTYDFEAGGAVSAGVNLFGLAKGNADIGGSYRMKLFHRGREPRLTVDGLYRIDWERKTRFGFTAKFGFDGFSAESEFAQEPPTQGLNTSWFAKAQAFQFGAEAGAAATQAYRYTFSGPPTAWSSTERDAFLAVLFPSVAESEESTFNLLINAPTGQELPDSPEARWWKTSMSQSFEPILKTTDAYKPFRSARIGSLSLFGETKGKLFDGSIDFKIQRPPDAEAPNTPVVKNEQGQVGGRTSQPKDKAESQPEEESKPAFKASATFEGKFDITYDVVEQLKHEVGDPSRVDGGGFTEQVIGTVHTLTFDTKYDYKADFATNLDEVKREIDLPNMSYPQEPQWVKDRAKKGLDWLAGRIAGSTAANFDGGLQFRVFSKVDDVRRFNPWRLEITFRGPKSFGIVDGQDAGEGAQYSLTFAVDGEAETNAVIAEIFEQAQAFRVLLGQLEQQRIDQFLGPLRNGQIPSEVVDDVDPKKLYLWFLKFVKSVLIYGGSPLRNAHFSNATPSFPEFYEEVRRGKQDSTDFGINERIPSNKKIGITINPFTLDSAVDYRISHGVVVRGQPVVLEDYGSINIDAQNPVEIIKGAIRERLGTVLQLLTDNVGAGSDKVVASDGNGGEVTIANSSLQTTTAADFSATQAARLPWVGSTTLPPTTQYRPGDNAAPPHKPHYGLGGGVRAFTTTRNHLAFDSPASLTLSYADAEVDGFSESSVRMFVWDGVKEDWTVVPGVLDTSANTVTAQVTRAGLYTLGPVMPAGTLTWTITGVNRVGSGSDARTIVALESSAIRNNDGSAVPAGTVVHTQVVNAGGAGQVLTADTDPALGGTQVLVGADGKVRIEVSLPGTAPPYLALAAYSHLGTVDGNAEIRIPQP